MSIENEGFVLAAKLSELSDRSKLCVEIDDHFVVLVRLGNDVFCLDDVCTHDGGTLGDGELIDNCLVCPRHGAHFDVRTGDAVTCLQLSQRLFTKFASPAMTSTSG